MENVDLEKIKSRIEKMLKKAQSAKEIGSLHEAEVFSNTANKLLMQYNLSMSDINMGEKRENIGNTNLELKTNRTEGDWLFRLYSVISKYNLCKAIRITNTNKVIIFGEKLNVDTVLYITSNLQEAIKRLCSERWSTYNGIEKKNTFKRGYYIGAVKGIAQKLHQQSQEMSKEMIGMTSLVKTNKLALRDKVQARFNNVKSSGPKRLSSNDGLLMGMADGRRMQVNKGIEN